jgi:uncharacterized iron-regulated membrane protein
MLLFSATGLTWSQWAGGNVDKLRAEMNWLTPQVNTRFPVRLRWMNMPNTAVIMVE